MRRRCSLPFHWLAHQLNRTAYRLNRIGWWITETPERKRSKAAQSDGISDGPT